MNKATLTGNITFHIMKCEMFGEIVNKIPRQSSADFIVNNALNVVVNIILVILTVGLNFITFLTIWRSRKLNEKACFFVMMLQSCADLCIGLFNIPLTTYVVFSEISSAPNNCILVVSEVKVAFVLFGISLVMYVIMTYER